MNLTAVPRLIAATSRITRLIVDDDVPGQWWIKDPIDHAMHRYRDRKAATLPVHAAGRHLHFEGLHPNRAYFDEPWWWKYRDGLDCKWCTSLHVAFWVTVLEHALPAKGKARTLWTIATTALALSEAAATVQQLLESGNDD